MYDATARKKYEEYQKSLEDLNNKLAERQELWQNISNRGQNNSEVETILKNKANDVIYLLLALKKLKDNELTYTEKDLNTKKVNKKFF